MGAAAADSEGPGVPARRVHVGPGSYAIEGLNLVNRASLVGAGMRETEIRGTVYGPRTGASISHLTVTGGAAGGVQVSSDEAPALEDVAIVRNEGTGLSCGSRSQPV